LGEVIQEKPKNGYSGSPVNRITNLKVLSLSATTSGKLDLTKFKYIEAEMPYDSPSRCKNGDIYLKDETGWTTYDSEGINISNTERGITNHARPEVVQSIKHFVGFYSDDPFDKVIGTAQLTKDYPWPDGRRFGDFPDHKPDYLHGVSASGKELEGFVEVPNNWQPIAASSLQVDTERSSTNRVPVEKSVSFYPEVKTIRLTASKF
jgi:hypothetical protein